MCDADHGIDIFQEPDGYYQQEKPATHVEHVFHDGRRLNLRLIGQSPLWGHLLWNAGRIISEYLEDNSSQLVRNRSVLELGAGAGLPSFTAALNGASTVVVTDYPDPELIENLEINARACNDLDPGAKVFARGLLWGAPVDEIISYLPDGGGCFDTLILADLLFNHSEHSKLVDTVCETLKRTKDAKALVFFTPYRPWLFEKDLAFFNLARDRGLKVDKILEHVMEKVMFEEDPGDELLRRTVFGYQMTWASID